MSTEAIAGNLAVAAAGTVVVLTAAIASLVTPNAASLGADVSNATLNLRTDLVLDALPAIVIALGADGSTIHHANRTALTLGNPRATRLHELFPHGTADAVERLAILVTTALSTGKPEVTCATPLQLHRRIGTYIAHAVPIPAAQPDAAVVLFITELGASSQRDNQLLRVEKLATVGVLAAGIAHEIGTPLGVIRGRADLVRQQFQRGHPIAENIAVIIEQIDRISRTIRALLDFARPRRVTATDVPIVRPIDRVTELVRFEAEKRCVRIEVDLPEDLPFVRAEPDKIEQILVNLVMNSLDATPPGGRIQISATRAGDEHLALRVRDSGCGIPSEHLHQVFDPFFTTKALQRGTGLGLSIVDQIARDHGGVVNLTSTVGRGTTVEVLLPAAPDDE